MPYVRQVVRPKLLEDPRYAHDVGDLNFLYSNVYKALWIKEKGYKTIEFISSIGLSHEEPQFIKDLDFILRKKGFSEQQLIRAKFLAFHEFMRRIGNKYEDKKILENGDIYDDIIEDKIIEVKSVPAAELNPGAKKRGRKKKNEQTA